MALLLVAATMTGFSALGVNATATYQTKMSSAGNVGSSNTAFMQGAMRYYYDTANLNILTKVAAYSEFVGTGTYQLKSGEQSVYLHNRVTVKYSAESLPFTENSQSQRFVPKGTIRYTDNGLYDDPVELNENLRTEYAYTDHWLRPNSTSDVWHISNAWR